MPPRNGPAPKDGSSRTTQRKNSSKPATASKPKTAKIAAKPTRSTQEVDAGSSSFPLSLGQQQSLLDTFSRAFPVHLGHGVPQEGLLNTLQEVKARLFERDFAAAFGKPEYLEAYACRWSPSRALGYAVILGEVIKESISPSGQDGVGGDGKYEILCLGGGAGAEIVALGGVVAGLCDSKSSQDGSEFPSDDPVAIEKDRMRLDVHLVDIADWTAVSETLHQTLIMPPTLSAYASATAKATNRSLVSPELLSHKFTQLDLLGLPITKLTELLIDVRLVTVMFTLNELYSTDLAATQTLLLDLTRCTREGTLLLVVDSPGSYSEVKLGNSEKKYPMQFLLDHTLSTVAKDLGPPVKGPDTGLAPSQGRKPRVEKADMWEKIKEEESRWFRMPPGLRYPLDLENMRCQVHLFRRTAVMATQTEG